MFGYVQISDSTGCGKICPPILPIYFLECLCLQFQHSDYERLVRMLLYVVCKNLGEDNDFVKRAGICLLNSLACQVGFPIASEILLF